MDWNDYLWFLMMAVLLKIVASDENISNSSETRLLSRRKRFLIFPDGSSLQLVFCCQTAALIPIGDIFLYGNTAALAWSLPTDPDFLTMFKQYERTQRRQDFKELYYLDEDGKVLAKVPYKRKPIINPAFAKRSIDDQKTSFKAKLKQKLDKMEMHEKQMNRDYLKQEHMNDKSIQFHRSSRVGLYGKLEKLFTAKPIINPAFAKRSIDDQKTSFKAKLKQKLDKMEMHEKQMNRDYLKQEHMNDKSIQFHRSSRVGLYGKLEKLFTALGRDGRQCVLHKLCEARKATEQGTFLQELARVVFTLPKGQEFENTDHKDYDKAHHSDIGDCSAEYPGCEDLELSDEA